MGYVTDKLSVSKSGLPLFDIARKELDKLVRRQNKITPPSSCQELLELIGKKPSKPYLKGLTRAECLRAYTDVLDRVAQGEKNLRYVCHVPAQHGKTLSTLAGLLYVAILNPGSTNMYLTYNSTRAATIQEQFCDMAQSLGYETRSSMINNKVVVNDCIIYFKSVSASVTGYSCDTLLVMDDLFISYHDALSPTIRDSIWERVIGDVLTRAQSTTSIVSLGTRFHMDDVSGKLLNSKRDFIEICIKALCEDPQSDIARRQNIGDPLWPERKSLDFLLQEQQEDPIFFAAVYQGNPRPDGTSIFSNSYTTFSTIPESHIQTAYGLDLAGYGKSTKSDYNILVKLVKDMKSGKTYLSEIWRQRVSLEVFQKFLQTKLQSTDRIRFYGSSTELQITRLINEQTKLKIMSTVATKSKLLRADSTYRAWNSGKLLIKDPSLWNADYRATINEVLNFTGQEDKHEDTVDAIAAAFDELNSSHGGAPKVNHSALINIDRQLAHNERL